MHERTMVKRSGWLQLQSVEAGEKKNLEFVFGRKVIGGLGVECRGGEERFAAGSDSSLMGSDVSLGGFVTLHKAPGVSGAGDKAEPAGQQRRQRSDQRGSRGLRMAPW
jgi:hypothetical protein